MTSNPLDPLKGVGPPDAAGSSPHEERPPPLVREALRQISEDFAAATQQSTPMRGKATDQPQEGAPLSTTQAATQELGRRLLPPPSATHLEANSSIATGKINLSLTDEEFSALHILEEVSQQLPPPSNLDASASLLWLGDRAGGAALSALADNPSGRHSFPSLSRLFDGALGVADELQLWESPETSQTRIRLKAAQDSLSPTGASALFMARRKFRFKGFQEWLRQISTATQPNAPPKQKNLRCLIDREALYVRRDLEQRAHLNPSATFTRDVYAALPQELTLALQIPAEHRGVPLAYAFDHPGVAGHAVVVEWSSDAKSLTIWNSGAGAEPANDGKVHPAVVWRFPDEQAAHLAALFLELYEVDARINLSALLEAIGASKELLPAEPCKPQRGPTCVAKSWAYYLKAFPAAKEQQTEVDLINALVDAMAVATLRSVEGAEALSRKDLATLTHFARYQAGYRYGKYHGQYPLPPGPTPATFRRLALEIAERGLAPEPVEARSSVPLLPKMNAPVVISVYEQRAVSHLGGANPPATFVMRLPTGERYSRDSHEGAQSVADGLKDSLRFQLSTEETRNLWEFLLQDPDATREYLFRHSPDTGIGQPVKSATLEWPYLVQPSDPLGVALGALSRWAPIFAALNKLSQEDQSTLTPGLVEGMRTLLPLKTIASPNQEGQEAILKIIQLLVPGYEDTPVPAAALAPPSPEVHKPSPQTLGSVARLFIRIRQAIASLGTSSRSDPPPSGAPKIDERVETSLNGIHDLAVAFIGENSAAIQAACRRHPSEALSGNVLSVDFSADNLRTLDLYSLDQILRFACEHLYAAQVEFTGRASPQAAPCWALCCLTAVGIATEQALRHDPFPVNMHMAREAPDTYELIPKRSHWISYDQEAPSPGVPDSLQTRSRLAETLAGLSAFKFFGRTQPIAGHASGSSELRLDGEADRHWTGIGIQETFGLESLVQWLSDPINITPANLCTLASYCDPLKGMPEAIPKLHPVLRLAPELWKAFLKQVVGKFQDAPTVNFLRSIAMVAWTFDIAGLRDLEPPSSSAGEIRAVWSQALEDLSACLEQRGGLQTDAADALLLMATCIHGSDPMQWSGMDSEATDQIPPLLERIFKIYNVDVAQPDGNRLILSMMHRERLNLCLALEQKRRTAGVTNPDTIDLGDGSFFLLPIATRKKDYFANPRAYSISTHHELVEWAHKREKQMLASPGSLEIILDPWLSLCYKTGGCTLELATPEGSLLPRLSMELSDEKLKELLSMGSQEPSTAGSRMNMLTSGAYLGACPLYPYQGESSDLAQDIRQLLRIPARRPVIASTSGTSKQEPSSSRSAGSSLGLGRVSLAPPKTGLRVDAFSLHYLRPYDASLDFSIRISPGPNGAAPIESRAFVEPGGSPRKLTQVFDFQGLRIAELEPGEGYSFVIPELTVQGTALRLGGHWSGGDLHLVTQDGWELDWSMRDRLPLVLRNLVHEDDQIAIPIRRGDRVGILYGSKTGECVLLEAHPITQEVVPLHDLAHDAAVAFLASIHRNPDLALQMAPYLRGDPDLRESLGKKLKEVCAELRQGHGLLVTQIIKALEPPPPVSWSEANRTAMPLPPQRAVIPSGFESCLQALQQPQSDVLADRLHSLSNEVGLLHGKAIQEIESWWNELPSAVQARLKFKTTANLVGSLLHLWVQAEQAQSLVVYQNLFGQVSHVGSQPLPEALADLHRRLSNLASLSVQKQLLNRISRFDLAANRELIFKELRAVESRLLGGERTPGARALLVLEWLRDIRAYPHQVEMLQALCDPQAPSRLIEIPPGGGKTSLLLIATALEAASRERARTSDPHPTLIVFPDALESDMRRQAMVQGMELLGEPLPTAPPNSLEKPENLIAAAMECARRGLPLLLTSSQLRLTQGFAAYLALERDQHQDDAGAMKTFLGSIVLVDEGDQNLDPSRSFNIEVGAEEPLRESTVAATCQLMDAHGALRSFDLSKKEECQAALQLCQEVLPSTLYSNEEKHILTHVALGLWSRTETDTWITALGMPLPTEAKIDQCLRKSGSTPEHHAAAEELAALATMIRKSIPSLQQMKYGRDYGPASETSLSIVPYRAANWPSDEKYIDPCLIATVSFNGWLQPAFWTAPRVELLHHQLVDLKNNPWITALFQELPALSSGPGPLQTILANPSNQKLRAKMAALLLQTEARTGARRISIPAAALASTCSKCIAVTGTAAPSSTLPFGLHRGVEQPASQIQERMEQLLEQCPVRVLPTGNASLTDRTLQMARNESALKPQFFLDPTGSLIDRDVDRAVDTLCEINRSNDPMRLEWVLEKKHNYPVMNHRDAHGQLHSIPNLAALAGEQKVAVFGQAQCRGTDLPRTKGEIAWLLLGNATADLGARDYIQAALRMRGLEDKEQALVLIMEESLKRELEHSGPGLTLNQGFLRHAQQIDKARDPLKQIAILDADLCTFDLLLAMNALFSGDPALRQDPCVREIIIDSPVPQLSKMVEADRKESLKSQFSRQVTRRLDRLQTILDGRSLSPELTKRFEEIRQGLEHWKSWLQTLPLEQERIQPEKVQTERVLATASEVAQETATEAELLLEREIERELELSRSAHELEDLSHYPRLSRSIRSCEELAGLVGTPAPFEISRVDRCDEILGSILQRANPAGDVPRLTPAQQLQALKKSLVEELKPFHFSPASQFLFCTDKGELPDLISLSSTKRPNPYLFWLRDCAGLVHVAVLGPYEASALLETDNDSLKRLSESGQLMVTQITGTPMSTPFNPLLTPEALNQWRAEIAHHQQDLIRMRALYGDLTLRQDPLALDFLCEHPMWRQMLLANFTDKEAMASILTALMMRSRKIRLPE